MIDVDDPLWGTLLMSVREGAPSCADSRIRSGSCSSENAAPGGGGGVVGASMCTFCSAGRLDVLDGNLMCRACFTVGERLLDYGAEWRYYGAEDTRGADPTRCCPPSNSLIQTLGCVIGSGAMGSKASMSGVNATIQKYQAWNSMTYRERTLCAVFDVLAVNAVQHGIPQCILEEAKSLYKRVAEAKISRGENRSALVACSMYIACKTNKVPRSIKEIAAMFNVRVNAMTKGCRVFQQMVQLDIGTSAPNDFVRRFCSRLDICESAAALASYIVDRADALSIVCDSTPPSVVAGAIQMANVEMELGLSKAQLAQACMVSPVTITKCYKRLNEFRESLLPPQVLDA